MEKAEPKDGKEVPNEPVDEVEAPEVDEVPLLEPTPSDTAPERTHPLSPGGKRFEQIYAKSKQAERDNQALRERLAAAEAKLDILTKTTSSTPATEPEYSWAQLEEFIQQGRITRADAQAHREEVQGRKLARQLKSQFEEDTSAVTRDRMLTQAVQEYFTAVPDSLKEGAEDRDRLEEEFNFIASINGVNPDTASNTQRKAFQLQALRNVFGSIDSIRQRQNPARVEATRGIPGGTPPVRTTNKDQAILDGLTPAQVRHYRKMMDSGRYKGGWKDVVAELKWEKPKGSR